ncbi:MAG: ECF-type sigma factor [Gemmatimonadota bacterium]
MRADESIGAATGPEPRPAAHGEREFAALLKRAESAESGAADQLFALLYQELHRLAEHHLRKGNAAVTLGTTTLVHEAYLNLAGRGGTKFPDRARFFAYASRAMRGLVIDYARRSCAKKRGRRFEITLDEGDVGEPERMEATAMLPAIADALPQLAALDAGLAELVDLHFFAGFSFGEIAGLRAVSERTVQRDWRKARLLLHGMLRGESGMDFATEE